MLRVSDLEKSFSGNVLFEHVSFSLGEGRRIGVVGPNGCGKTTLLRILAGLEEPDAGQVSVAGGASVAYLPQHIAVAGTRADLPPHGAVADLPMHVSGREAIVDDLLAPAGPRLRAPGGRRAEAEATVGDFLAPIGWDRVRELEQRLARGEDVLDAFADALDRAGGYGWEARAEGALDEVRLRLPLDRDVATLSGGERTRLALARVLMANADVLLLDEPTNHLDAIAIERLEHWLLCRTAVIVSHDRRLLDRVAHETLALEPLQARARIFAGGYSAWRDAVANEEARAWREYRDQQQRVRGLSEDIRATRDSARGIESRTVNDFARGRAKKVAAKAKARETRLERMLSDEHRKEKPRTLERVRLVLEGSDRHGAVLVRLDHAGVPGILHDVSLMVAGGDRILVRGTNGGGKTTLLRLLLCAARPDLTVGYLPQHQETLPDDLSILDWLRQRVVCDESEIRAACS